MKFKFLVIVCLVLSIIVIGAVLILNKNTSFTVLATSYSEDSTSLYSYEDKELTSTNTYPIGGAESIEYKNKDSRLIYNKYGDELLSIKGDNTKKYNINYSPVQLEKNKEELIVLHNGGINLFSISKYDSNYDTLKESDEYSGFALSFVTYNDMIYVLANVYDENSNRTVGIYTLDLETLEVINFTEIEGLTFGFYLRQSNDELKIYGNSSEELKDLTIYSYNLTERKTSLLVNSDIKAMWVSKVLEIDNKEIILNDFSIISLDKNNNPEVEFKNEQTLIEFEYDEEEEIYYLLSGNVEEKKFKVIKLNKEFDVIESISLNTSDKIPTDLELN